MTQLKFSHRIKYGWYQWIDKWLGRKRGVKLTLKSRRKFYEKVRQHLMKGGPGKLVEIDRVSNITLKELKKNYIRKSKPVVIEGGAKEWGCVKDWSIDYFRELHGDDEVTVVANDALEAPYEFLSLSAVLDDIQAGGSRYYRFYPLLKNHPEHIHDFDYEWIRKAKSKFGFWEQFQVFIGGKDTYTPIHNAMASNIFVQAHGEKEWVMYPPQLSAIIDPEPSVNFHRGAPFKTTEGPYNPFESEYPPSYSLYEYIDGIKVHLKPGDIMYNPPHYWHAVRNPTESIGIGYRWISPGASFRSAPWYTFMDVITAPFNKNVYLNMKKDYNIVHLIELGAYNDYLKDKKSKKNG